MINLSQNSNLIKKIFKIGKKEPNNKHQAVKYVKRREPTDEDIWFTELSTIKFDYDDYCNLFYDTFFDPSYHEDLSQYSREIRRDIEKSVRSKNYLKYFPSLDDRLALYIEAPYNSKDYDLIALILSNYAENLKERFSEETAKNYCRLIFKTTIAINKKNGNQDALLDCFDDNGNLINDKIIEVRINLLKKYENARRFWIEKRSSYVTSYNEFMDMIIGKENLYYNNEVVITKDNIDKQEEIKTEPEIINEKEAVLEPVITPKSSNETVIEEKLEKKSKLTDIERKYRTVIDFNIKSLKPKIVIDEVYLREILNNLDLTKKEKNDIITENNSRMNSRTEKQIFDILRLSNSETKDNLLLIYNYLQKEGLLQNIYLEARDIFKNINFDYLNEKTIDQTSLKISSLLLKYYQTLNTSLSVESSDKATLLFLLDEDGKSYIEKELEDSLGEEKNILAEEIPKMLEYLSSLTKYQIDISNSDRTNRINYLDNSQICSPVSGKKIAVNRVKLATKAFSRLGVLRLDYIMNNQTKELLGIPRESPVILVLNSIVIQNFNKEDRDYGKLRSKIKEENSEIIHLINLFEKDNLTTNELDELSTIFEYSLKLCDDFNLKKEKTK